MPLMADHQASGEKFVGAFQKVLGPLRAERSGQLLKIDPPIGAQTGHEVFVVEVRIAEGFRFVGGLVGASRSGSGADRHNSAAEPFSRRRSGPTDPRPDRARRTSSCCCARPDDPDGRNWRFRSVRIRLRSCGGGAIRTARGPPVRRPDEAGLVRPDDRIPSPVRG